MAIEFLFPLLSLYWTYFYDCFYSRSSRDNLHGHGQKPVNSSTEPVRLSALIPPPPPSKRPVPTEAVDYLSGDSYKSGGFNDTSEHTSYVAPAAPSSPPPSSDYVNPTATLSFPEKPVYDEPASLSKTQSGGSLPPPPSKYNQRQQFFEQHNTFSSGTAHSSSGSSSSYDSLVRKTDGMSLDSSTTPTKEVKPEDALFKDLVDFAKAKSSSPSKPNRSY